MLIKSLTENTGPLNILKFFFPFHLPSENILAQGEVFSSTHEFAKNIP